MTDPTIPPRQSDFPPIVFRALQCSTCRHYRYDASCSAYPRGIPLPILGEWVSHKVPRPGDHGIQWEAAPAEVTDGPVRYCRVLMPTDRANGWDLVGAIWIGAADYSAGWEPTPRYLVTDETRHWIGLLRRAWQLGRSPGDVMAALPDLGNGLTVEVMAEERAPSLARLRHRLARIG